MYVCVCVFTLKTGSARGLRGTKRSGTLVNLYNNAVYASSKAPLRRAASVFGGKKRTQRTPSSDVASCVVACGAADFARSNAV